MGKARAFLTLKNEGVSRVRLHNGAIKAPIALLRSRTRGNSLHFLMQKRHALYPLRHTNRLLAKLKILNNKTSKFPINQFYAKLSRRENLF